MEWKLIPGYESYEVSDCGNVRRTDGLIMQQHISYNGYMRVGLRANGKRSHLLVHRLVMAAFVGPCPDGKQVNHIDENRSNNQLLNLEYVTPGENVNHGTCQAKKAARRSKPVSQFSLDHVFIKTFSSLKEASEFVGISHGNICSCCRGERKSAGGFCWEYCKGGEA